MAEVSAQSNHSCIWLACSMDYSTDACLQSALENQLFKEYSSFKSVLDLSLVFVARYWQKERL
jgi:hypothetical protein